MSWSKEHERLVGEALAQSRDKLLNSSGARCDGVSIVFETIAIAVDIDRRYVVRGGIGPAQPRSLALPYTHDPEDAADILKQRMIDLTAGDHSPELFGLSSSVSPAELSVMEAILSVFRDCLRGRNQVRDWNILFTLAKGYGAEKTIQRDTGLRKSRISDIKISQCGSIWGRVRHLLPPMRVSHVFVNDGDGDMVMP